MPNTARARRPSIRDVAERAGVSLGSASHVINGAPDVSADVRARVAAAVKQLGYRPNHAAQSLRLSSTRTIGCMLSDVANPLYGQLFHAIEERLRAAGYVVLLANSLNRLERELDIVATFAQRGMDGVLLAPGNERDGELLHAVRALDRPVVILDRDMLPECDRVQFDHAAGMRAVIDHLGALGHRRIALVLSQGIDRPMRRRIDAFRAALAERGIALPEGFLIELPSAMSPSYAAVSALLARPDRPTALLALGTNILHEALNAIAMRGWSIPRDISVVSIGDPDFARSFAPPLSALRVEVELAAARAVELLLARLDHTARGGGRTVRLPSQFVARESCAAAPRPRVRAA